MPTKGKPINLSGGSFWSLFARPLRPKARDAKDFAIEFGEYLAKDVEAFLQLLNESGAAAHVKDQEGLTDHWRGLQSAIYEFRKRAGRVR